MDDDEQTTKHGVGLPSAREHAPRLLVIARPSLDIDAFLSFVANEQATWRRTPGATEAEEIVEGAGRICYLSFGRAQSSRTTREYIAHLIAQGHESVLEHVAWSFLLTGVTRAFTHQFVRHRAGFSFSQLSQQYHEERSATVLEPEILRADPQLDHLWTQSVRNSQFAYAKLLDALVARADELTGAEKKEYLRRVRSAARSVLPEGTETTIFFTANARAIRHFLDVRGAVVGDDEMRLVSSLILHAVKQEAPALFADFEASQLHGLPIVRQIK